jgi:large subunit ribosomal protein L24
MAAEKDYRPHRPYDAPLPIDDIRLVHSITDPATGETKEVIVDSMEFRPRAVRAADSDDKAYIRIPAGKTYPIFEDGVQTGETEVRDETQVLEGYRLRMVRYIPGLDVEINSVEKSRDEDAFEEPYNDDDTLLIQTEEETFVPPLTTTPMPASVIDELRNKYSRFRTRHEDEYLQARADQVREKEVAMEKRERMMRTPLTELSDRRAKVSREIEDERELGEDVLAKIGEAMVRSEMKRAEAWRQRREVVS